MKQFVKQLERILAQIETAPSVVAIRSGLLMMIPVLLIGSATLVFKYFPITQYQTFVETALSGRLLAFFNLIYNATFGMLSVFLALSVSFCYAREFDNKRTSLAASITSLICFFVLSGVQSDGVKWDALGVKGMFLAILSAILASKLLLTIMARVTEKAQHYTEGSEVAFNHSVSGIFPASIVVALFALVNTATIHLLDVNSFFELFVNMANAVFLPLGRSFLSGLLMVLVSSLLWFFGIHGSNVLESVMDTLFTPAIQVNIQLLAEGHAPTELLMKQFFDTFVFMGGCGTALCLLLAILLFSKRRGNRRLSKLAAVPMLFNINELMIFGFPVIFNPIMLVPFVATPLFAFISAYIAMRTGLVPLITSEVNWTAPVFVSGYIATGSIRASLLQLLNVLVGIFIYRPFVLAYDRKREAVAQKQFDGLVDLLKQSEETVIPVALTELTDEHGAMARSLLADLKYAISEKRLALYYQPQYNNRNICIGAEALLRWKHPIYGMVYPPLIIQLAREGHFLCDLEEHILQRAVADRQKICDASTFHAEIGVNVSAATIQSDHYFRLLQDVIQQGSINSGDICLEITEQTALLSSEAIFERLQHIKNLGYRLAIDDFSMGHTSLTYLQENQFDAVKLDGTLVRGMMDHPRTFDIIKSITGLSQRLGFCVIAEFVEEEAQVKLLEEAGCFQYQGYLFSPALDCDQFIQRLLSEEVCHQIAETV